MTDASGHIRPAGNASIEAAAALLREGRLVAFPTETVYGLGADATSDRAVASVFEAKGRPRFNPLIVHFADPADIGPHAEMDARAETLARAFWPGPLTLVLPRRKGSALSLLVSAGLDTVAVRCPVHEVARALIAAAGMPIAAPSANRSGGVSPTTAAHVAASLDGAPAMILDGGATAVGIESTVIDLTAPEAALLRPGAVTREEVERLIGPLAVPADGPGDGPEKSPGLALRHYAPDRPIRVGVTRPRADDVLIAFGPDAPEGAVLTLNLSPAGDLAEAAANLFRMLHEADARAGAGIAVMPVPDEGLGAAINDRLRRAAGPLPPRATGD